LFLNQLQALNAHECLYFSKTLDFKEMDSLKEIRATHPSISEPQLLSVGPSTERDDGIFSQFMSIASADPRIGAKFTFASVIDDSRWPNYLFEAVPHRFPDAMGLIAKYKRIYRQASKLIPPRV